MRKDESPGFRHLPGRALEDAEVAGSAGPSAKVAAVTDPEGAPRGVHRTRLDPAGQAKADVLP